MIFFDEFNNYLIQDYKNRRIERNKAKKKDAHDTTKIIHFSLRYVPKELRFLICKFLIKKRYIGISYCVIYNKKKCPKRIRNIK